MRLIKVYHADFQNGTGMREVLFFSGCSIHCPGCFNKETWNPDMKGSSEWTESNWEELKKELSKSWISGVTLTGGDPFSPWNRNDICALVKRIKKEIPGKDIWVYSGYSWDTLVDAEDSRTEALEYIDVLCEGPFIETQKSPSKLWVGSENQRVIDVSKSLSSGIVELYE